MTPRAALVVSLLAASACARSSTAPIAPRPKTTDVAANVARMFLTERASVVVDEAAPEGAEAREALVDGVRVSLRRGEIVAAYPLSERLDGFRVLPARLGGHYVLWSSARTFVAPTFAGELRPIAGAPSRGGVRPWLDGVLLRTDAGVLELDPKSFAARPVGFVALADAIAIDTRRAARVDSLGRASLTTDGGATWLDLEAARGELVDSIHTLESGGLRLHTSSNASLDLDPRGDLHLAPPVVRGPRTYSALRAIAPTAHGLASARLAEAVVRGVPIDVGRPYRVLVGGEGKVAVVSLASGDVIDELDLPAPDGGTTAKCQPLRFGEDLVVACDSSSSARVYTLRERDTVFDLEASFDGGGTFVFGGGDRFGRVGPCGPAHRARRSEPEPEEETPVDHPAAEAPIAAKYCARVGPGRWVERAIHGAVADKIVRWTPGPAGTVTAIALASQLDDGALPSSGVRVVRLRASDEKLDAASFKARATGALVDAGAWQDDDGSIHAWLATSGDVFASARIDERGALIKRAPPEGTARMSVSGRFALAAVPASADQPARALFSSDAGASYHEVEAVPPRLDGLLADPIGCSELGCAWQSGLVRVGAPSARLERPPSTVIARPSVVALAPTKPAFKGLRLVCAPLRESSVRAPVRDAAKLAPPTLMLGLPLPSNRSGIVEVLMPFDARATPSEVTLPAVFHEGGLVAPVLGARGVDLLLFGHERALRASATSASPWPFDAEGRPTIAAEAAGGLVLLDADRAVVQIARPSGVAVAGRLVRVPFVDRTRLTLGRRADGRLAVVGYSTSSGELWSGALDLGSGDVAPLVALASLDRAADASRCRPSPGALSMILELPVALKVDGARPLESEPLASVLATVDAEHLCIEGIEARAIGDRFVARFASPAVSMRFADAAPPLELSCALSIRVESP